MRKVISKEVTAGGRFDLFLDSEELHSLSSTFDIVVTKVPILR